MCGANTLCPHRPLPLSLAQTHGALMSPLVLQPSSRPKPHSLPIPTAPPLLHKHLHTSRNEPKRDQSRA